MARCEDFPCCGHESGCCPDYDESGKQLNMVCTCGAKLPVTSRFSICESCMRAGDEDPLDDERWDEEDPLDDDRDQNNPVESADWDRIYSDPDYDMDHDHSMDY